MRMLLSLAIVVTVTALLQHQNEDITKARRRRQSQSTDPQYCSIGQLRRHLSESDRIDGGGGTYFLPDNISSNGRLVSVHTCFFYNDNRNKKHKKFRLRVGVFRQKDPQDCSIGQLRQPLSESDRIDGGGGTYFLPDEVSCNGSLVSVHTCFFYNDVGNNRKKVFRLRVGVFRQNITRNQYIRENVFNIDTRRDNSSVTQNCTSMHLPDPLPAVLEGDRLAVHILDGCTNACPLQPNLNISAQTSVFFMPYFNPQWIAVNRVMAKQNYINVYLDVSASIVSNDLTSSVLPTPHTDPQDCSIGQLRRPLNESDRINGGGGTYFLPDEVLCNGRLVSVHTCFFYKDEGKRRKKKFRLHVGVFRRMGDNYLLDSKEWIDINVMRQKKSKTQGCEAKSLKVPVPVLAGDRIAVRVKKKCNKQKLCPLQPNLKAHGSTSVFFTQSSVDTIPVSQVMATKYYTNVHLDVSVSIERGTGGLANQPGAIAGIVIAAVVFVLLNLIMFAVITCYVHSRSKNGRSTHIVYENISDGDLQTEYHQVERPQSYVQPCDPKDSTHPDNQSITMSQESGRQRFLKRMYSETHAYAVIDETNSSNKNPSPHSPNDAAPYSSHYEVDEDYGDPYWHPSSMEDELRMQLINLKVQEIPRDDLQLQEYLGSGQFGTVNRGMWSPSPSSSSPEVEVAVKSLERESTEEERVKFLQEAAIMGQFKHPNIIRIVGVVTTSEPLMIVCELMEKGDLHHYLLSLRRQPGNNLPPEMLAILLSFSRQIAAGMGYLAGKSFVHRDLAARNILVSENDICKIADFGLSRDLQNEDYYVSHGRKIPVKWTAPEALKYHKYSTASDVWSYGVLLYEIWAMGIKPFRNCTNSEALQKVLKGYRLPPPPGCPKQVYELMIKCWHPDPDSRPAFCDLLLLLQRPDFELLRWSEEDEVTFSKEARTLGGPLEDGKELYTELQTAFS